MIEVVKDITDVEDQEHDPSQVHEDSVTLGGGLTTENGNVADLARHKGQTALVLLVLDILIIDGFNTGLRSVEGSQWNFLSLLVFLGLLVKIDSQLISQLGGG